MRGGIYVLLDNRSQANFEGCTSEDISQKCFEGYRRFCCVTNTVETHSLGSANSRLRTQASWKSDRHWSRFM